MDPIIITIIAILAAGGGITGYNYYQKRFLGSSKASRKDDSPATPQTKEAETKAREIIVEARDEAFKIKKEAEEEARKARSEVIQLEQRLASKKIKESESMIKEEADKKAKEILVSAMQRGATDYVLEYTTSVVKLPDDEIKGRIIGKEGRNIRAWVMATGVDFDIDDTPGEIRLSSFDGERREVAKVSLERLIADGRIQPQRIEEIVDRTK